MMTLKVDVIVQGYLRELYPHLREKEEVISETPLTARQIISRLGIKPETVLFVMQEGRIIDKDYLVESNTELVLVSPPAGG
ncbi:MAG: MoaD/ThiS family protein [Bacillota bacterium]|nr:MoaD/ThiS family protein [Bacillota bacterium]